MACAYSYMRGHAFLTSAKTLNRYRIESFGIKLLPPNSWHKTFTLSRLLDQAPITTALAYPMSDQLDDWRDYQRSKNVDRGEDFAMLHEILREPTLDVNKETGDEDMERMDSGYFSRRSSKLSSRVNSIPTTMAEGQHPIELGASTRSSSLRNSMLADVPEMDFRLVAEGTPSTPDSEPRTMQLTDAVSALDGALGLSGSTIAASEIERARWSSNSSHGDDERRTRHRLAEAVTMRNRRSDDQTPRREHLSPWISEWGVWCSSGGASFDGIEEGEFVDWVARRCSEVESIEEIAPEASTRRSVETVRRVASCMWVGNEIENIGGAVREDVSVCEEGETEDVMVQKGAEWTPVDFVNKGEEEARRRMLRVGCE